MTNCLFNISIWMHSSHSKLNVSQHKFLNPFPIPQQVFSSSNFIRPQLMATLPKLSSYLDQNPWSQIIIISPLKTLQWFNSIIRRAEGLLESYTSPSPLATVISLNSFSSDLIPIVLPFLTLLLPQWPPYRTSNAP